MLYLSLIAAVVTLSAPLFIPLVTGTTFTKDDLAALHLPFRYLYQESLRRGEFLTWTPAYHAGFFVHGAGEAGMAHPLHLLFYSTLPLTVALNLEIISSYAFLFAGVFLLLRAFDLAATAAVCGAMLSAFSGFTVYNLFHVNHIATLAHAPWLLLACYGLITGKIRPAVAFSLTALVTGSQLLTGNPQYVWLTLVAVVFLCGTASAQSPRVDRIAALGLAAVLGGLIGAAQILPSYEFFNDSVRSAWDPELATTFSLSPFNVVQLWAPFAFEHRVAAPPQELFQVHEFIVYNGAFCTVALAWIALRWPALHRRPLALLLIAFGGLALWLAFGRHGGLYPALASLPVLRGFRAPARHVVLFQFALASLAAIAFEDLARFRASGARMEWRRLWPLSIPAALAVLTTIIGPTLSGSAWATAHDLHFSTILRAAPWIVAIVVMALLIAAAARGRAWALPLMLLLAAMDLAAWGYSYQYSWASLQTLDQLTATRYLPPLGKRGDVIPPVVGAPDAQAILNGLRLTRGYTGLYPQSRLDFGDPAVEHLAGVQWRGDGDRWTAEANPLPRARLLAHVEASNDAAVNVRTTDPARTAIVEQNVSLGGEPGTARVSEEWPGFFDVRTSAEGQQLLVMTERFHEGWQVRIDGEPAPAMRVYGDFLGCLVPSGSHQVTLQFKPRSMTLGLQLSMAGLLLTALCALALDRTLWRESR